MHRFVALLLLLPALAVAQPAGDDLVERYVDALRLDESAVAVGRSDQASAASPGPRGALGDSVRAAFAEDLRPHLLREALTVLEGPVYARVQAAEHAWTERHGVAELMLMMEAPIPDSVATADSALVADYVDAMRAATQPTEVRRATLSDALLALPEADRAALEDAGIAQQLLRTDAGFDEARRRTVRVARRQLAGVDPADLRALAAYHRSEAGRYVGRRHAVATGRLTLPLITASLAETAARVAAAEAAVDETPPEIVGGLRGLQERVEYPAEARRRNLQGQVVVQLTVTVDGRAQDVSVIRSVHPVLDAAAVEAVRRSRFRPGTREGVPVAVEFAVPVTFRLR